MRCSAVLALMAFLLLSPSADADEIRPAYLELVQNSADTYSALWKVPARGDQRLGLYVRWPDGTTNVTEPYATRVNLAYIERSIIRRDGGLNGQQLSIDGLIGDPTDVLVRIERLDGTSQVARLSSAAPAFTVTASPDVINVAVTYGMLGFEHILIGFDHLLFVLGLVLVVGRRWGMLVKTVTSFTLAHSITLALATLGVVNVPSAPVEAIIALSIMFVAAEIMHARAGKPGLTARAPWVVAFVFGLLHGFGFAGALMETGLPENAVPLALMLFNIGVELGQLLFVVVVLAVMNLLARFYRNEPRWATAVVPYAIGTCAAFWTIERVTSFVL